MNMTLDLDYTQSRILAKNVVDSIYNAYTPKPIFAPNMEINPSVN